MKKSVTIILILLISFDSWMVYPVFFINRHAQKEKIEHLIKHDQRHLIAETLVFHKGSHEFKEFSNNTIKEFPHNNSLYDLTGIIRSEDSVVVFAINDVREKQIVNGLLSHQDNNVLNLDILKLLAFAPVTSVQEVSFLRQFSIGPLIITSINIITNSAEVLKPPPRLV